MRCDCVGRRRAASPSNDAYCNRRRQSCRGVRVVAVLATLLASAAAVAGGGPESVLVVVNTRSQVSLEVANHYVRLRNIPASNVVAIAYDGPREAISGERFRREILTPILTAIDRRRLAVQIDAVAYCPDFPWRIELERDYPKGTKFAKQLRPIASLTGATFLWPFVQAKSPGVVSFDSNWCVAPPTAAAASLNGAQCVRDLPAVSRSLHGRDRWAAPGKKAAFRKPGRRYLMATMLGVTTGRGNTLDEVLACLRRAVEADATPPTGTFYFMRNRDIRSKTRHNCYEGVAAALRAMGAKAVVAQGKVPKGKTDVAGMTLGSADLGLDAAAIRVQPGALCEHLTSFGGVLKRNAGQTPLSELIRYGAAGASGTVFEPYSVQAKFPLPSLQLHYRRGVTLAEAFYQSVQSPYQLLIVGDPICQPWASRPSLTVEGWPGGHAPTDLSMLGLKELGLKELGLTVSPTESPASAAGGDPADEGEGEPAAVRLRPVVSGSEGAGSGFWEFYVDGRMRMRLPSGQEASFSATDLGPGWHELRCVGVAGDPIEATTRKIGSIFIDSAGPEGSPGEVSLSASVEGSEAQLAVSAPGGERIELFHNARRVGEISGDQGEATLATAVLGRGPVRLQAVAQPSGARSAPVWVTLR